MDSTFHRPFALALALGCLAASPAHAQLSAGDACPELTPGRVFTQEGAAGPALVCNGTTLEVYESVLTGPLRKGIGTASPAATLDVSSTDSVLLPRGTTAERPGTPVNGMIRYNSTLNKFEAYENGAWTNVIGGGTASAAGNDREIQFNNSTALGASSDFKWTSGGELDLQTTSTGNVPLLNLRTTAGGGNATAISFYNNTSTLVGSIESWDSGLDITSVTNPTNILIESATGNTVLPTLGLYRDDSDSAAASGIGAALTFNLETATDGTNREAARIAGVWDDATNNSKDGSLRFYTMGPNATSGTTTTTERMRIGSNGNVGIGNSNPQELLHVGNGTSSSGMSETDLIVSRNGSTALSVLNSATGTELVLGVTNNSSSWLTFGSSAFYLDYAYQAGTEFTFKGTGSLGIGTTSPEAKLDVAGEVKVGNTSLSCSGTTEGAQRYNSTSHVMEYCNGTSWVGFGSGVTSNCPTSDVTSGLVARWQFDESSGTSAADSSGNSLAGTLTNGPVWNPNNGYLNGALTFDGSDDYVTVADPGTGSVLDFAGGSSMTITAWVMLGIDASDRDYTLLSKASDYPQIPTYC